MRITQGTFSYLPDFTDEDIEKQIKYAIGNGWAMMVEYTDDPHPRNSFWDLWKQPEFELEVEDSPLVMKDVHDCRAAYPNHYVKVVAYDSSLGRQTSALSFIVNRPQEEPGFRLVRQESHDRSVRYTVDSYAQQNPAGRRYGNQADLGTTRDPAAVQDATPGRDSPLRAGANGGDVAPATDEGVGES